jgi:hypothetical protein
MGEALDPARLVEVGDHVRVAATMLQAEIQADGAAAWTVQRWISEEAPRLIELYCDDDGRVG